jgi:hypothetical protein
MSRQIIQRIPKSNILPQPTNYQQQSFQMATLHSTHGVTQNNTGDLSLLCQSSLIQQTKKLFAAFP